MISLLGIDLLLLFKYPDFFILKLAYDGFINVRLQNILGIQYIIDLIVYISLGLKYLSEKNYSKRNIFLPIILILTAYVINIYNIELYEKIIKVFKYILFLITAFFIIILIKKEKKLSLKNDKFCNYN